MDVRSNAANVAARFFWVKKTRNLLSVNTSLHNDARIVTNKVNIPLFMSTPETAYAGERWGYGGGGKSSALVILTPTWLGKSNHIIQRVLLRLVTGIIDSME